MNEQQLKESFVKLCTQIFLTENGFQFPFDAIVHDDDFSDILNDKSYSILENKMKNLIDLVNQNNSTLEKDIESEIWYMV